MTVRASPAAEDGQPPVNSLVVMPGLGPGIHVSKARRSKDVDGRDKPGHDEVKPHAFQSVIRKCHRFEVPMADAASSSRNFKSISGTFKKIEWLVRYCFRSSFQ